MKKNLLNRLFGFTKQVSEPSSEIKLRNNLTILIVDDSRTQIFAIEKILKDAGVTTATAENGKQAILMTKRIKPDLVLMDIVMPEINGFQATRYLTRQKDTAHIPIIIISGSDQESDKTWGLKLGAKDFMRKPVDRSILLEKVKCWTAEAPIEGDLVEKDNTQPAEDKAEFSEVLAKAS